MPRIPELLSRAILLLVTLSAGDTRLAVAADAEAATAPAKSTAAAEPPPFVNPRVIGVESSVVQVRSTVRLPDLGKPWAKQAAKEISGSGVIIEGKRILTNAHVVLYAAELQVQGHGSGNKVSARVEFLAPGIDLAVLRLEDDTFFEKRGPLPRAKTLPVVKDTVTVYGFPTGGTGLSITKGIVSRIDYTSYNYPVSGLRIQIDAAINAGNSGGPAVVGEAMIGLAYSRLGGAQNIGYIIPNEEIELFLHDVADGKYDGKPLLFDEYMKLENATLRGFLKAHDRQEGVVVRECDNPDPAYPLKKWDVITKIGDTAIDREGKVILRDQLRVAFSYLIQHKVRDGKVPLTVWRDGNELIMDVPTERTRPKLIPHLNGAYPDYFIFGTAVFSVATEDYVSLLTSVSAAAASAQGVPQAGGVNVANLLSAIGSPLMTRRSERATGEEQELVLIPAPLFPHKLTKGYGNPSGRVVKSVNGKPIQSLRHLVETVRDATGDVVIFELAGRGGETLVLPRKEMIAATDEILAENGIRTQGSPAMMKVWAAK